MIALHTREEVESSDAYMPLTRYRVSGGWLYHAHPDDTRNGQYAALCFVPDIHEADDGSARARGCSVSEWQPLPDDGDKTKSPFDSEPVLIAINTIWGNRVHRVIWTDAVHGHDIFGWAVEDRKFGPYPLRGYTTVAGWMPLPEPPSAP